MCIAPITLRSDPTKAVREHTSIVPCGKCPDCLEHRRKQWCHRLQEETKVSSSVSFLTFTYDEENIITSENGLPTLESDGWQKFMKKLRKEVPEKLKYFTSGEYGEKTGRPHYHSIMYNLPKEMLNSYLQLEDIWQNGRIHWGQATQASIMYTLKYITKGSWDPKEGDDRFPERSYMSKGLGKNYLKEQNKDWHYKNKANYIILPGGTKTIMPRYYKDQIWSPGEQKGVSINNKKEDEITTTRQEHDKIQSGKNKFKIAERNHRQKNGSTF